MTHELAAVSRDFSPAPESEAWFLVLTQLIYLSLGKQQRSLSLPLLPDTQKFVPCTYHCHLVRVKESVCSDTGILWETGDFEKKQMLSTTLYYLVRLLDKQLGQVGGDSLSHLEQNWHVTKHAASPRLQKEPNHLLLRVPGFLWIIYCCVIILVWKS